MIYPDLVVVGSRLAWQPSGQDRPRVMLAVDFDLPDYAQRQLLWRHYLATHGVNDDDLDPIIMAAQFSLTTGQIRDAVASARNQAIRRGSAVEQPDLFAGARLHSGARLGDMARKIIARYGWDDIVLPNDQVEILRELVSTVRQRSKVLEEWGLGKKLASSGAVTVLFAGPPGTGKTMSAEVIAKDLGLDLYKIDLSNLVSKYIGETEKNLERIFTEAQSSNAILFFDEADAIFGKRSGVKDAHDRYANLEISYLLQRMETYDGVTILATNLRSNLDEAFLRRLQFAIDIPFPDEKHRLQIWETLFPTTVPRASDVDLNDLAKRFRLAGGNIRNILISAAYLAAADRGIITMQHLLHGTRREFQKMGRLVMDT
jgi:ATP-dependent 26S proteasome regulatory subunit